MKMSYIALAIFALVPAHVSCGDNEKRHPNWKGRGVLVCPPTPGKKNKPYNYRISLFGPASVINKHKKKKNPTGPLGKQLKFVLKITEALSQSNEAENKTNKDNAGEGSVTPGTKKSDTIGKYN